jgi:NADPH:quinone reductase-like Zn-dependent oxidoreductase
VEGREEECIKREVCCDQRKVQKSLNKCSNKTLTMTNQAAFIPAAKAPLEVQDVEKYKPGPHEILIKNEVIALNPIDYKIARLAIFPMEYPAIIGSSFGGTVEAVGSGVKDFKVGDRIAAAKKSTSKGSTGHTKSTCLLKRELSAKYQTASI